MFLYSFFVIEFGDIERQLFGLSNFFEKGVFCLKPQFYLFDSYPKVDCDSNVKNFKPINLVGYVYKFIAKLLGKD